MRRALWPVFLLAGCVTPPPGEFSLPDGRVSYACDGGKALVVTYDAAGDPPSAVIDVDGRETLLQEPSETGLRYAWPSDGSYHILQLDDLFKVPGGRGTLSYRDGEAGTVTPVLTGCRRT